MSITGCNLCLETIKNDNFKLLEGALKDKLQVLIPVINWGNICREPKVCHKCSKIINKTYGFKIFCLDNNKKLQKLKSAEEILAKNLDSDSEEEDEDEVCCLCCQEDISEDFEVSNVNFKEMVQKCFPQLNIYSSNSRGSCEDCLRSLKILDSFTNNCLESENYVKNYCSTMGIKRRDRFNFDECIKRKNFPPASVNNNEGGLEPTLQEIESTTESNADIETTQEPNRMASPQEKNAQSNINDSEESVTKLKKIVETSLKEEKSDQNKELQVSENLCCNKCNYIAKAKYALVNHMIKHMDPSEMQMYICEICGHGTKRKGDLKWHMIVHKNPEEVKMYQCADCQYKTKRKADLKHHVVVHRSRLFKCSFCSFETKNELYLNTTHMLLHPDKSEIEIIKCKLCPYEAKNKLFMRQHSKTHIKKFKCNWCDFDTIYKQGLKQHLLTHKCLSEREMFKCEFCDYESGFKSGLRKHMVIHDNSSQTTFECDECTFKTKRKRYLMQHRITHQPFLEPYECDVCPFKSKYKASLKHHLRNHIIHLKTLPNKESEINTLMLRHSSLSKS